MQKYKLLEILRKNNFPRKEYMQRMSKKNYELFLKLDLSEKVPNCMLNKLPEKIRAQCKSAIK